MFIPAILVGDNKSLELLLVHLAYYLLQLPLYFFLSRFGRQDVASASHWYSVLDAGNRRRSSVTDRLSYQYVNDQGSLSSNLTARPADELRVQI